MCGHSIGGGEGEGEWGDGRGRVSRTYLDAPQIHLPCLACVALEAVLYVCVRVCVRVRLVRVNGMLLSFSNVYIVKLKKKGDDGVQKSMHTPLEIKHTHR